MKTQGKQVDISKLLYAFQAQEGSIQSYTGKVGNGKTYGATRRALRDLQLGRVVYLNWHLTFDHFIFDQRDSVSHAFWNLIFFRKRFYKIDMQKNYHFIDMDDSATWVIGDRKFDSFIDFIAMLTDAVVYLDEGQDVFDSYEGTKMSLKKRKSLTRTRHLNKTLVIISQRPQAIAVTARANVQTFYRHVKVLSWPFLFFKVLATEEIDSQNMPIWDDAKVVDRYFGSKKIFKAYNSWYLRAGIPKSQDVHFEAFDLRLNERITLFVSLSSSKVFAFVVGAFKRVLRRRKRTVLNTVSNKT